MHESLVVGFFLSIVGGILDSHTFLFRHGIFANTQTGNIVFLALSIATQNFSKTLRCLFSLASFIIGIFITEAIRNLYRRSILKFVNTILGIEIFFLTTLTIFPKNHFDTLVIVVVAFVCSLQTNSFRSLKGSPYASTMCTGNLRSAAASFSNFIMFKSKKNGLLCLQYLVILLSFFCGVILGKFLTESIFQFTFLFCSIFLITALLFINIKNLKKIKKTKKVA